MTKELLFSLSKSKGYFIIQPFIGTKLVWQFLNKNNGCELL